MFRVRGLGLGGASGLAWEAHRVCPVMRVDSLEAAAQSVCLVVQVDSLSKAEDGVCLVIMRVASLSRRRLRACVCVWWW